LSLSLPRKRRSDMHRQWGPLHSSSSCVWCY